MIRLPLRSAALAAFSLLVSTASAQKLCASENDAIPVSFGRGVGEWAIAFGTSQAISVTGLEFQLEAAGAATSVTFRIYDEDPNNGEPRNVLGQGVATLDADVGGWYEARLASPVALQIGPLYFVAFDLPSNVTPGVSPTAGTPATYFIQRNGVWNGPIMGLAVPYRVYCDTHQGAFQSFPPAKPGSGNRAPALRGIGFPNTTNTIRLQMTEVLGGASGVLVVGPRANAPIGLGTLLATPLVTLPLPAATGAGAGGGHVQLDLPVPNEPALNGAMVATQAWFLDPGASDSLSHTGGVEVTFGD